MALKDRRIPLGSCDIYMMEVTTSQSTVPDKATMETTANLLGEVKGGGVIKYNKETYTAESDNGKAKRTRTTREEVTIETGVMTIDKDAKVWKNLIDACVVTTQTSSDKPANTIKIGGLENEQGKEYWIRCVQRDPLYGDVAFSIKGTNTGGFEYNAKVDAETVLNGIFTAVPLDDKGTLLQIDEFGPTSS